MVLVSAPGKVLLCGGYLVLERPNRGLVVASSARFYSEVTSEWPETVPPLGNVAQLKCAVVVQSPQFRSSFSYEFRCRAKDRQCTLSTVGCELVGSIVFYVCGGGGTQKLVMPAV